MKEIRPAVPSVEYLLGNQRRDPFGVLQRPVEESKAPVVVQQDEAFVEPQFVPDHEPFSGVPSIKPRSSGPIEITWVTTDDGQEIQGSSFSPYTLEDDVLGPKTASYTQRRRPGKLRRRLTWLTMGLIAFGGLSQAPKVLEPIFSKDQDKNTTRVADVDYSGKIKWLKETPGIKGVLPTELPIVPESPTPTPTRTKPIIRVSAKPVARESALPTPTSTQPETPAQSPTPKPTTEPTTPPQPAPTEAPVTPNP